MKKLLTLSCIAIAAQSASAQSFVQMFTGNFIDGGLAGYTIEGLFEIDAAGQSSGTAEFEPFSGPEIFDFTFEIFNLSDNLFSDFMIVDDMAALATFDTIAPSVDQQVTTFDFIGTNFAGENLDFFYDAFASDPSTAFAVSFDDGSGNISNATLSLPTAVPEPSAFAALAGVVALGFAAVRRRRAA